nr:oligopeptide/dipeptide ABC transporter ATP-binding protein [Streptacidiphilus sp. P02-A3a]
MVEGGDSETVTQRPAHPYTQLLIASAPDPDRILGSEHSLDVEGTDSGEPPSLITPPGGCRFHPRCPHAMAICGTDLPPRFAVPEPLDPQNPQAEPQELGRPAQDGEHWAACWLFATPEGAAR